MNPVVQKDDNIASYAVLLAIVAFMSAFLGTFAANRSYAWWIVKNAAIQEGVPVMPYVYNDKVGGWDRMRGDAANGIKCYTEKQ